MSHRSTKEHLFVIKGLTVLVVSTSEDQSSISYFFDVSVLSEDAL